MRAPATTQRQSTILVPDRQVPRYTISSALAWLRLVADFVIGAAPHGNESMNIDTILRSVVAVRSSIPEDAFTAATLGIGGKAAAWSSAKRAGAHHRLSDHRGRGSLADDARTAAWCRRMRLPTTRKPASAWCRRSARSICPALDLGDAAGAKVGDPVVLADGTGQSVAGRHRHQAGIRRLLGISAGRGDLHRAGASVLGRRRADRRRRQASRHRLAAPADGRKGEVADINMVVPINLLPPILDDLLSRGQVDKPPRPWLGAFSAESNGEVVVMSVAEGSPAAQAGPAPGRHHLGRPRCGGRRPGRFLSQAVGERPRRRGSSHADRARRPRNMAARQVGRPQQLSQKAASAVARLDCPSLLLQPTPEKALREFCLR